MNTTLWLFVHRAKRCPALAGFDYFSKQAVQKISAERKMQGIFLSFLYRDIVRVFMFTDIKRVHQEFSYTLTVYVSSTRSLARLIREVDESSCSFEGYVDSDGKLWNKDKYGYLGSASPVDTNNTRAFKFNKDKGKLNNNYNRNNARPCLSLIKHSFPRSNAGFIVCCLIC